MGSMTTGGANIFGGKGMYPLQIVAGVNDIVASALPSGFAGLQNLQGFIFESMGANTGIATLDIGDGVPRPLTLIGGAPLIAGDIPAVDTLIECYYDSSTNSYHAILIRQPAQVAPLANGVVAVGSSTRFARADHVHPINSLGGAQAHNVAVIVIGTQYQNTSAQPQTLEVWGYSPTVGAYMTVHNGVIDIAHSDEMLANVRSSLFVVIPAGTFYTVNQNIGAITITSAVMLR